MGSDKIIHFTETHLKNKYTDFCVDMSMNIDLGSNLHYDDRAVDDEYEYNESYEYNDNSTSYDDYYGGNADYDSENDEKEQDLSESGCIADMGTNDESNHQMLAVFCDYDFIEVRKCCDKSHNLNLR